MALSCSFRALTSHLLIRAIPEESGAVLDGMWPEFQTSQVGGLAL
jgi:hypothetical protein